MFKVIFIACMLNNPTVCKDVNPHFESMGLSECIVKAQQNAATWFPENMPKWFFQGWRCMDRVKADQIDS